MEHKTTALALLGLTVVLAVVTVVLGIRTWGGGGETAQEPPASQQEQTQPQSPDGQQPPEQAPEQAGQPTAPAAEQATDQPVDTAEPTEVPWAGPDVPEQATPADASYFADAAFLGNSVLSGLWYYDYDDLLPDGSEHWYWADSLTIMGAKPYASNMSGQQFGKIYIEFGINEVNYDQDTLRTAFNEVIDLLQQDHPDAVIYLTSVTPVSKYCDENREFKRSAVQNFNSMLRDIATEQQVWYLDVYPELCGEDGYLPSDVTNDGVHFTPGHYEIWFDYLKTHYVT